MQHHFRLLAQVPDITPILAINSLAPWEHDFESHDRDRTPLSTRPGTRPGERLLCTGELQDPCLRCVDLPEELELILGDWPLPQPVALVLAAMGLPALDAASPGTTLGRIDKDQFDARISAIDAGWSLLRRLKSTEPDIDSAIEAAVAVARFTQQWQAWRMDSMEQPESKRLIDRCEQLIGMSHALKEQFRGCRRIELHFDPRGSACMLEFDDTKHGMAISPLSFDWPLAASRAPVRAAPPEKAAASPFMLSSTRLDPGVLQVLRDAVIDARRIRLGSQLDRKLYARVNEVLTGMGGRWRSGQQAHVFDIDPRPMLTAALATGSIYTERDYEFFRTPDALADEVVREARLEPGMLVLDPQAGDGQFAARAAVIVGAGNVTCYELMPANIQRLRARGLVVGEPTDFLTVQPEPCFDVVLTNPPFSGGRDMAHVLHALQFLKPGGRLVAVTSTLWRDRDSRASLTFRERMEMLRAHVREVPRGTFHESGTDVPTLLVALNLPGGPALQAASTGTDSQPALF